MSLSFPFLNKGVTLVFFQSVGTTPSAMDALMILVSGLAIISAESLNRRGDMLSNPADLLVFNYFLSSVRVNCSVISFSSNRGTFLSHWTWLQMELATLPRDWIRRETAPTKKWSKASAIFFLSTQRAPSTLMLELIFLLSAERIFLTISHREHDSVFVT